MAKQDRPKAADRPSYRPGAGLAAVRLAQTMMALFTLIALGVTVSDVQHAGAQCPITHVQKFGAPDPSTNRCFGDEIALDGELALIASQFDDYLCPGDPYCDAGSVQVFALAAGTWTPTQRLTASEAEAHEYFGAAVALAGNRALIGAYGHDTVAGENSGYVYDFRFDGDQWVEHRIIEPSDAGNDAWFGWQVVIEGNVAAVAAQNDNVTGAVYIYRFANDEWVEAQKLTPGAGAGNANFGHSLAMEAGRIMVGANNEEGIGAVYIYTPDGAAWVLDQKLTPPAGATGDRFGEMVAIRGAFCMVGATDENGGAMESGAVHVYWFDGDDWLHTHRLVPSDLREDAAFGSAIELGENLAIIGAVLHDDIGEDAGQAYTFTFNGMSWSEAARLRPAEVDEIDSFGAAVAIDGAEVMVGAIGDDDPCGGGICRAGAVYVFRPLDNCDASSGLDLCEIQGGQAADCNANLVPDACDIDNGTSDDCDGNGVPDECDILAGNDCNANLVPDACDIAQGTSPDCNGNGLPDECDPYAQPAGEQKVLAPDPTAADNFGSAVAVLGDVAVVGAPYRDVSRGMACVLRRTNGVWAHEAALTGDDITAYDYFGCAVAVERGLVFCGAYEAAAGGVQGGAVYAFRHDGAAWVHEARLIPLDHQTNERFGWSVAACGDRLIAGAPQEGPYPLSSRGAAYIFRHDGASWAQEAKLLAPDIASGDYFGISVAVDGDVAVVGEYYDDEVNVNSGAAHVFRFDGQDWVHEVKLINPAAGPWDYFGSSVAVSGDLVAVGAIRGTVGGQVLGAVYVYRHDGQTWVPDQVLIAQDPRVQTWFGRSTSIVGSTLLTGAHEADVGPVRSGAAYLFQHDGVQWSQRAKLSPSDGEQSDWFGYAVAFDGFSISVGAPYENAGAGNVYRAGACYFYEVPVGPPLITRQPSSLRVGVGARAAFAVTAVGAEPLSYRWQHDGQDLSDGGGISGARTAQLVIAQAGLADIGRYRCVVTGGCGQTTSREARLLLDELVAAPEPLPSGKLMLAQNRPNPFNPSTRLEFTAPGRGRAAVRVYNLRGELVVTLLDGEVAPGPHTVIWKGTDANGAAVTSGAYICRVTGFGQQVSRMLTLVR